MARRRGDRQQPRAGDLEPAPHPGGAGHDSLHRDAGAARLSVCGRGSTRRSARDRTRRSRRCWRRTARGSKGARRSRRSNASQIVHAREVFERVIAQVPDQASAHVGLANACVMQFEMTRSELEPDTAALAVAAAARARGLPARPGSTAKPGRRSGSCSIAPATTPTRSRRRDGPSHSNPTTGAITCASPTSAGAKSGCARRGERSRCCQGFRSRTGSRRRSTWRGRRSTRPSASSLRASALRRATRRGDALQRRRAALAARPHPARARRRDRCGRTVPTSNSPARTAASCTRASAARTRGTPSAPCACTAATGLVRKRPSRNAHRGCRCTRSPRWRLPAFDGGCADRRRSLASPSCCVPLRPRACAGARGQALRGDVQAAAALVDGALAAAPAGSACWTLPVEPMLARRRGRPVAIGARAPAEPRRLTSLQGFSAIREGRGATRRLAAWKQEEHMKRLLLVVTAALVTAITAEPLLAQSAPYASTQQIPPVAKTVSLAGPRYGFTFLDDGVVAKLKTEDIEVKNGISQFGWQFERQFYSEGRRPLGAQRVGDPCRRARSGSRAAQPELARRPSHARTAPSSASVRTSRRSASRWRWPPASHSAPAC